MGGNRGASIAPAAVQRWRRHINGGRHVRNILYALPLFAAAPLAAQIATPERPVTDPKSVTSPANPQAGPVAIEDLVLIRQVLGAAWSADGRTIFTSNDLSGRYNLWRSAASGSWPQQLTQSDDMQYGLAVSPDGQWLYFQQDRGGDEQFDILAVPVGGGTTVNLTNTPEIREVSALPSRDGKLIAISTKKRTEGQMNVAVIDAATRKSRALTSEADAKFIWTPVAWVDGDKALIVNRVTVDQTIGEVWRIDVASGRATKLLAKPDVYFSASGASPDGARVAVTSNEGTGQSHAMILDAATGQLRGLAPTPWEQSSGAVSPDGRAMLVSTGIDGRKALALVDMGSGAERPLPLPEGVNSTLSSDPFSPDGTRLLATHSGADAPTELYAVNLASGTVEPVTRLALASLQQANLPKSRIVTYRSYDGSLVSGVLTMPFNLQRDGSNPAVVVPHGGPTGQAMDDFSQWATALASRGYVVIQPNFRGSTGYGLAFQKANYKDLGGGDLKDVIAAKDFLVASGYVDRNKVGIAGGSYGGFMTLMAIGKSPDTFAAAVNLFGIIDWAEMWKHEDALLQAYQRSLIGSPDDSPDVYKAASPMTYIQAAKVPLLVLQGDNDIRVPAGQSRLVIDTLKAKGNIVEGHFYPAEGHGFYKRENNEDSLRRMIAWFDKYLKGAK